MITLIANDIKLVSENKRLIKARGRFILSQEYRNCKEELKYKFLQYKSDYGTHSKYNNSVYICFKKLHLCII